MALYSFALVGSNFLAPIMCGWINDGQGYKWVFYWPTIFCAAGFIFMSFFMEETNYDRKSVGVVETWGTPSSGSQRDLTDPEKRVKTVQDPASTPGSAKPKKTFLQKLSLKDRSRPQLMHHRIRQQLAFVLWPNVFYAGFAYGSTLIWFNVLNATASIIFTAPP